MSDHYEKASDWFKNFDFSGLPPGEYKVVDGKIIPIESAADSSARAASDRVSAALKAFADSLEDS